MPEPQGMVRIETAATREDIWAHSLKVKCTHTMCASHSIPRCLRREVKVCVCTSLIHKYSWKLYLRYPKIANKSNIQRQVSE